MSITERTVDPAASAVASQRAFDAEAVVADFYDAFETAPDKRLARIREVFADDLVFCDDLHDIVGAEALDEMGRWLDETFPGAVFETVGEIRSHHRQIHFAWSMKNPDGTALATGHDLLLIGDDGRISHDYSFITPVGA